MGKKQKTAKRWEKCAESSKEWQKFGQKWQLMQKAAEMGENCQKIVKKGKLRIKVAKQMRSGKKWTLSKRGQKGTKNLQKGLMEIYSKRPKLMI